MAASGENVGEGLKNLKNTACRASREGRVPCPHHDCDGNAVFFQKGAGLDVHYRSKHGTKSDATAEKTANQKLSQLCFEEMKQRLQDLEVNEQAGEQFSVTSPALSTKVTATRPEVAAKKAGIVLHAGAFLNSFSSGRPPYPLSVEGKDKEVNYHLWYLSETAEDSKKFITIVCKPVGVKMFSKHPDQQETAKSNATCPAPDTTDIADPLEECLRRVFSLPSFRAGQKDVEGLLLICSYFKSGYLIFFHDGTCI
ncbi:uncharacterized protein [Branchiostoma lanceolatum]|uniref:uncharacterized protein n=1 Tax=Branchiostoma lanceolatum TaxID=7740 RepID=UPI003452F5C2